MNRNVQKKRVYLEAMRVLACALVLFNHMAGYNLYSMTSGIRQVFFMSLTMITRINAPLFFMISGALLFPKNDSFASVFRKRFLRILCLLVLFDLLLFACHHIQFITGDIYRYEAITGIPAVRMSVWDLLSGILMNRIPGSDPYWYLYSHLGLLFVLPFMQRIAKGLTKTELISLIALHFIASSFLPVLNLVLALCGVSRTISLYSEFIVPFAFAKPYFYTLIGYYLENRIDTAKLKPLHIIALIGLSLSGIAVSGICTVAEARMNGAYSQNFVQLFDYVIAIAAFLLIKLMFTSGFMQNKYPVIEKAICFMGSVTLGIYMFDPVFKQLFIFRFNDWLSPRLSIFAVTMVWVVISMCAGTVCTCILKKLPVTRKLL
ncbi:MAG: acyltransferase [Solobacterium sp.]|nr:acyltransferase [Solobacterium sp.]